MSRTATQLAGNASSIFQAWLDLKRQADHNTQFHANRGQTMPGTTRKTFGKSQAGNGR
ncbi:hypothetical protein [Marinobacter algicola]|uniref:hypothetical protein n=1 Tax=Marinobacter algicola TaxID=236100 RepID=UPI003BA940BC